jgi:hypothetical protein
MSCSYSHSNRPFRFQQIAGYQGRIAPAHQGNIQQPFSRSKMNPLSSSGM